MTGIFGQWSLSNNGHCQKHLMGATTHNVIYGTFVIDKGANTDIKCQRLIKLLLDLSFYVNVLEI